MIISIDIETAPGDGFEAYEDAALDHHRNKITQIAWATSEGESGAVQSVEELNKLLRYWRDYKAPLTFIGHNFKFDLKTLITKGAHLSLTDYHGDTMLLAVADYDKIPADWFEAYEIKRKELNAALGKEVHRKAGQYSLKSLAPYHLGVAPFWETDDHNNVEYAIKDAQYTLQLYIKLVEILKAKGCYPFYAQKLIPWAQMILEAELRGAAIDLYLLNQLAIEAQDKADSAKATLLQLWQEPIETFSKLQARQIEHEYEQMAAKAMAKAVTDKTRLGIPAKYEKLKQAALDKLEPFNIDSPSQLMWLLRDYYNLDITTFEGDESTGKSVLTRLAGEGRKDLEAFLEYRKNTKLCQAFFPSYKTMQWEGRLHPNFNLNGTRTGRLSSSGPNLQQVPGSLHRLIIAGQGRRLVAYDLSNIEPILIAYTTECPKLCKILLEGRNFHDHNVRVFFDIDPSIPDKDIKTVYARERKVAKELGLLLLYGGGARRIQESAQKYGFTFSKTECEDKFRNFRKEYEAVYSFKKLLDRRLEDGEPVKNLLGRYYKIADRQDVYMKGFNTYIQSSASDLLIESVKKANSRFKADKIDYRPILFVHDEVVLEGAAEQALAAEKILLSEMLGHTLETPYGTIKLKAEGGIYYEWQKG